MAVDRGSDNPTYLVPCPLELLVRIARFGVRMPELGAAMGHAANWSRQPKGQRSHVGMGGFLLEGWHPGIMAEGR